MSAEEGVGGEHVNDCLTGVLLVYSQPCCIFGNPETLAISSQAEILLQLLVAKNTGEKIARGGRDFHGDLVLPSPLLQFGRLAARLIG